MYSRVGLDAVGIKPTGNHRVRFGYRFGRHRRHVLHKLLQQKADHRNHIQIGLDVLQASTPPPGEGRLDGDRTFCGILSPDGHSEMAIQLFLAAMITSSMMLFFLLCHRFPVVGVVQNV